MTTDRPVQCDISVMLTRGAFVTARNSTDPHEADPDPDSWHLALARSTEAPAQARHALAEELAGKVAPDAIAQAQLVVSELVSNAVEHGIGDDMCVSVSTSERALRISVRSLCRVRDLRGQPAWELPAPTSIAGRGLPIVSSLAVSRPLVTAVPDGAFHNEVTVTAELSTETTSPTT